MGVFENLQAGNKQQPDMQNALQELKKDPGAVLSRAGYQVPDNLKSSPQAIIQHLMHTGQIPAQSLQRFAPVLQRMGIR